MSQSKFGKEGNKLLNEYQKSGKFKLKGNIMENNYNVINLNKAGLQIFENGDLV